MILNTILDTIIKITVIFILLIVFVFFTYLLYIIIKSTYNHFYKINTNQITIKVESKKGSQINKNILDEINKSINNSFNRTINSLNFTIIVFAVSVSLFALAFGFFSFEKIKELSKLYENSKNISEKYQKEQLQNIKNDLLGKDLFKRKRAIVLLSSNTT